MTSQPFTALFCDKCGIAVDLSKVPAIDDEDVVDLARRIARLMPESLDAVSSFLHEHRDHEWKVSSIEPMSAYRSRS